jgi:hypothetical protein
VLADELRSAEAKLYSFSLTRHCLYVLAFIYMLHYRELKWYLLV